MKKSYLIIGIIVVLGACSSPKKSEETAKTDDANVADSIVMEIDSMAMEVDSMVMEVDTMMTDSL